MEKIFNWDDIQEKAYIEEEGRYTLKIMSFENKTTASGNECHNYTCQTKDGEQINVSLYLTEKSMWKYKNFVKACGLLTEGPVNLTELPKQLIGKKFEGEVKRQADKLNVETGEYEKSKYFEVVKYFRVAD